MNLSFHSGPSRLSVWEWCLALILFSLKLMQEPPHLHKGYLAVKEVSDIHMLPPVSFKNGFEQFLLQCT